jgi:hypothetical protein
MKVLKVAAIVVGVVASVALIATGVGAFAGTALGAGILGLSWGTIAAGAGLLSMGLNVLSASKPKGSVIGSQTEIRLDPQAGIPYAIGRTLFAGLVIHQATFGADNAYMGTVLDYSGGGPISGFESFQVDRVDTSFSGGAATGAYAGFMWLDTQLGACPEAAALASSEGSLPDWGSSHKTSGHACGLWTTKFDKKGKIYAAGFPQLGAVLNGVLGYDARLDDTYPGGSGDHRSDDEETFEYSENPGVVGVTWALGRFQNGERVLGVGQPITGLDMPAWVEFANNCDDNGWKVGGVVSSEDDKWDVLKMICQAGGGQPMRLGGLLSVDFERPRVSLATITSSDLMGDGKVVRTKRRRERFNTVIARYRSEDHGWEIVPADPVSIAGYVTIDGETRSREVDYPLVQDLDQATELGLYDIGEAREFPISLPLRPVFVGYKPGDCLTIDISELGLDEQDAVIVHRSLNPETVVAALDFRSETAAKHDDALGATGTTAPAPDLDPGTVPTTDLYPFLVQTSGPIGLEVRGTDAGGSASIVISDHFRRYSDGDVAVDGTTLTGKAFEETYGLYYDDEPRAGGAVSIQATTTLADAVNSADHPFRHHLAIVTTPADGDPDTYGGGSAPGGGGGGSGGGIDGGTIHPY